MSLDLNYYFEDLSAFPFAGFFDGLKTPADILVKAKSFLKETLVDPDVREEHGEVVGCVSFYGNYYIGEGSKIYNGVTIMGPVYIGKNVEILPDTVIRPYTIIGDGCSIGHGSELKHAVLFNGAKVASLAFVGDAVLGRSARIGSGVITANRKFDQSSASVKIDGVKHDLGSDYFGCILGDYSRLGANSVTQPGTHIGPYSWIFPMTCVRGFIPAQKRVYEKKEFIFEENERTVLK